MTGDRDDREGRCPDGGYCHGSTIDAGSEPCDPGACYRVRYAGPLSDVYPGDRWPDAVKIANGVLPPTHGADRDALLDVIGAIEGYARGDQRLATLLGSASRARRHLDRTADGELPAREEPVGRDLEERLVRAFGGLDLLPGSTLRLTERAAVRMAAVALDVFRTSTPRGGSPREP